MATQTLPHVVPFPQSVPAVEISQQELVDLIEAQNTFDKLKKHVDALEESLISRLRAGTAVEDGIHTAEVKTNSRRTPAWKEFTKRLAKRLGLDPDQYCSNVIAHTKPSVSYSLVID